ncbi:metallophosphoesterase [Larkinella harenae]
MAKTIRRFVISDLHFGHQNILSFIDGDSRPIRPFSNLEEMHNRIISQWNETVTDHDKVYVLGDIAMPRQAIKLFAQLRGRKVLVKGNHDLFKLSDYTPYFEDIRSLALVDNRAIMTHIPIHPECVDRFGFNIHGHTHAMKINDPRYINVCVEQIGFRPVLIEDLLKNTEAKNIK